MYYNSFFRILLFISALGQGMFVAGAEQEKIIPAHGQLKKRRKIDLLDKQEEELKQKKHEEDMKHEEEMKADRQLTFVKKVVLQEPINGQRMPTALLDGIFNCFDPMQKTSVGDRIFAFALAPHGEDCSFVGRCKCGSTMLGSPSSDSRCMSMIRFSFNPLVNSPVSRSARKCAMVYVDGENFQIRLFDVVDGSHRAFKDIFSSVVGLHILPCERATIAVSEDGKIQAWSNISGKRIRMMSDERGIRAVAFAARTGKYVATSSERSNIINIWDLSCGTKRSIEIPDQFAFGDVRSLALSSNGTMLAMHDGNAFLVIDTHSMKTNHIPAEAAKKLKMAGFLRDDALVLHDEKRFQIYSHFGDASLKCDTFNSLIPIHTAVTAPRADAIGFISPVSEAYRAVHFGCPLFMQLVLARQRYKHQSCERENKSCS